jgi:hypothetical protein
MNSKKAIMLAVAAAQLFILATVAFAQSRFVVSSSPLQQRQTGITETAGDLLLTSSDSSPSPTILAGTNLTITFIPASATISNDPVVNGTNLIIETPPAFTPMAVPGATLAVGALSNSLVISFSTTVPVPLGTRLRIRAVRINDQSSGITFPGQIQAQLNVTPPDVMRFDNVNIVNVSTPLPTISVSFPQPIGTLLQCLGQTITRRVVLSEQFSAVFTSITQETNLSNTPPPTNPTRIEVILNNVLGGLTVAPPASAELRGGASATPPSLTLNPALSQINLLTSVMTRSILLTYDVTGEPDLSAIERTLTVGEVGLGFDFTFTTTGAVNTQALGCVEFQVRLAPLSVSRRFMRCLNPGTPFCLIPRFVDPFIPNPARQLICVTGCACHLKFPFVTNALGYDTGLAIVNTTLDPYGTAAQSGTITLHFFGSNAPAPPRRDVGMPAVAAGGMLTGLLSSLAPGFQGYVIAVANFQFCEGFAFIGDRDFAGIAEGYIAMVIPDPVQLGGRVPGFVTNGTIDLGGGTITIRDTLGERLLH